MKNQYKILLVMAAGLLFAASWVVRPATAQDSPSSLKALLEHLRDTQAAITIEFARPLVSGELIWSLPDDAVQRRIGEVGGDYVCFSEPWNDTSKERCTPFSNIIGVSYVR